MKQLEEQYLYFSNLAKDLTARKDFLFAETSKLKTISERNPQVVEVLEHMQQLSHEKAVGIFEKLLSLIVRDVLPNPKNIVFELSTERGLPSLEFFVDNQGKLEDVVNGQGGSLINVLTTGLRMIALQRSNIQKFLVLDEQECWIKESRVAKYVNVVQEISTDLGIQTIIISHKDISYFQNSDNIIKIFKNAIGVIETENTFIHPIPIQDIPHKYISKIRLINFMSHEDTTINLHPYTNVLCGENDLGKSAVGAALRAVFYSDSNDTFIKHNSKSCAVEITTSEGCVILWQRFLKNTSGVVSYKKFVNGVQVNETSKKDVPLWVIEELNISTIDGFDVCLQNQKKPLFLLGDSAAKKASILSIGKDSSYVQKMIQKNKEIHALNNQTIKHNEKEYNTISKKLKIISNFILDYDKYDLVNKLNYIQNQKENINFLKIGLEKTLNINTIIKANNCVKNVEQIIVKNTKKLSYDISVLSHIQTINLLTLPNTVGIPKINDNTLLYKNIKKIETINNILDKEQPKVVNIPKINLSNPTDLKNLAKLKIFSTSIETLKIAEKLKPINTNIINNAHKNYNTELQLTNNLNNLFDITTSLNKANKQHQETNTKLKNITTEIKEIISNSGNLCPLCNQKINDVSILMKA